MPARYMMKPTTSVLVNVPKKANTEMASKFVKSVSGLRVYPLKDDGEKDQEEELRGRT